MDTIKSDILYKLSNSEALTDIMADIVTQTILEAYPDISMDDLDKLIEQNYPTITFNQPEN